MEQQFRDSDRASESFGSLSGARIVRIATHPDYQRMGYGARAMELLQKYYEMKIPSLEEADTEVRAEIRPVGDDEVGLLEERLTPRENLPPLLLRLNERKPERLDYLGVSFGLTQNLLRFWKKAGFVPTYLRQTANDLTGEYTCIMLRPLDSSDLANGPARGWEDR